MNFKKAQGLPLNTIIIALLVVIVLVVIVLAFTSNLGSTNQSFQELSQDCEMLCKSLGKDDWILTGADTCPITPAKKIGEEECCCESEAKSISEAGIGIPAITGGSIS